MALSDSLTQIRQKEREGEEEEEEEMQLGGEGDPDSEATSALVQRRPDGDEQEDG